jgi:hypothetical protein
MAGVTGRDTMNHEDHIMESKPGSILIGGFVVMCRNWRCLTWAFFLNLLLAAVATVPDIAQLSALLNHSLAAHSLSGRLDLAAYGELFGHLSERPSGIWNSAMSLDFLFAFVLFIFTPAVLSIYLGDEVASLGNLFRIGLRFFWRMVRITLLFALIAGITLGILAACRAGLLNKLDDIYVERGWWAWAVITGLIVAAVAVFFRIWFDLAELITVERGTYRIGRIEDRAVRRTLGPAFRLFRAGFLRLYFSFILVGALGLAGFVLALLLWHALPPGSTFLAFIFAQIGLFLLLAARFWQRGLEVAWFDVAGAAVTPQVAPITTPVIPPTYPETPPEPLPV